jgi:NAD(P)H-hydrate epimerase
MLVLSGREMAEADRHTIQDLGVPSLVLMEEAGRECVEALLDTLEAEPAELGVLVVCGKGNNGGDGLVIARLLASRGALVRALLLWPAAEFTGDAAANLAAFQGLGGDVIEAADRESFVAASGDLEDWDVVVDAVFGTGLEGPVRGWRGEVLEEIAASPSFVLAVDLPSGLTAGGDQVEGPVVSADLTVTMAALKPCLVLPPACHHAGDVAVAEIGIPPSALERAEPSLCLTDPDEVALWCWALEREPEDHKGNAGRVLVVAGSVGKSGAAAMTGLAALRGGAGLVTVSVPAGAWAGVAPAVPEVMVEQAPEGPPGRLGTAAVEGILELARYADVLAIGPGLGREEETCEAVVSILEAFEGPRLVDADGLYALGWAARSGRIVSGTDAAPLLLTPHPGEATFLLERDLGQILEDRRAAVRECAERFSASVLLKGYRSLAAEPEGMLRINPTGGPVLATGGTGDVLTGLIAALLAQGLPPSVSLSLAAYLHGWAGDRIAESRGAAGTVATDLLEQIPVLIGEVLEGELPDG